MLKHTSRTGRPRVVVRKRKGRSLSRSWPGTPRTLSIVSSEVKAESIHLEINYTMKICFYKTSSLRLLEILQLSNSSSESILNCTCDSLRINENGFSMKLLNIFTINFIFYNNFIVIQLSKAIRLVMEALLSLAILPFLSARNSRPVLFDL